MFCYWLLPHISPPYKIIKPFTQKQQSPVEWDNYILIKKLLMSDHSELETGFIWWFLVFMNCIMIMTVFHKTSLLKKHNIYTCLVIHDEGVQYPFRPRNRDRLSSMDLLHSKKATCKPLQCPSFRHSLGFLPSFTTQSCWRRQARKSSLTPLQARPSSSLSS